MRVLVTGGTGFVGSHSVDAIRAAGHDVRLLVRDPAKAKRVFASRDLAADDLVVGDVTDAICVERALEGCDAVVHAAAVSDPDTCQRHPVASGRVNVAAAGEVAACCARRGIPCAFTSSDLVFDGRRAPYREDDPVAPVNRYGEQKAAAEARMAERWPATAICRMPLMIGATGGVRNGFDHRIYRALKGGRLTQSSVISSSCELISML